MAATVTLRRPFAALDLPLWAQMSDDELDALSTESVSDVDEQADFDFDVFESDEELGSAAASTACSSPEALSKPRSSSCKPRWADFAVSDDVVEVSIRHSPPSKAARWADLVDSDDEPACPARARWADLVDSDDDV